MGAGAALLAQGHEMWTSGAELRELASANWSTLYLIIVHVDQLSLHIHHPPQYCFALHNLYHYLATLCVLTGAVISKGWKGKTVL